jgi:uncharacterized protein
MYKLSHYLVHQNIFDTKDQQEKVILFSTRQSVVKILDKHSFYMIVNKNFSLLNSSLVDSLKQDKIIVDEQEDELETILKENKDFIENSKTLYFVIQPTAFCPFGCHYCGQSHSFKSMDEKTQDQLINRIILKLSEKKYEDLKISWFGAEPLSGLGVIRKLSYRLQEIAKDFGINYSSKIVTNGWKMSLPIAQELVNTHKVDNIEITLDGTAEFHDNRRHTKSNGKTFNKIYNNLLDICREDSLDVKISVRCNIDARNKDGISPLIKKFVQDNLQSRIYLYFAQIHSWGNDAHMLAADKQKFATWELEWLVEMEAYGFKVNYLYPRKKQVCMALNPLSELIDPNGGIFGCTEVSLVPSYGNENSNIHQLGNVNEGFLEKNKSDFSNFYDKNEIEKFPCKSCEIFPICGGSCPKEWKEGRVPCPSMKFNSKDRLLLYYIKKLKTKEYNDFLALSI